MILEEGVENSWARHARMHNALRDGLEAMGLGLLVEKPYRLPQLNTVSVPDGVAEATVRTELLKRYSIEIGAGLGALAGKVWRVGLMGTSATPANVTLFLAGLEDILSGMGAKIEKGAALPAAQKAFAA
jgi:alanine-glyoxylate transaminase/serine-glyoxylate transaminase/serine-pyruvate transaminase